MKFMKLENTWTSFRIHKEYKNSHTKYMNYIKINDTHEN